MKILSIRSRQEQLRTRMPFRYGIATMTDLPHLFLDVEIDIGCLKAKGISADHLPPKWFTKNPDRALEDEIKEMTHVIGHACELARSIEADTVFLFWWQLFCEQDRWAQEKGIEPLLAHFGTSLVERAVIDAFCRQAATPFHMLLKENAFGVDWSLCERGLLGFDWQAALPASPLQRATLRHTVGMLDPLTDDQIADSERLDDGLPQSLEDCIRFYGLRHFKLKLCGRAEEDLARLREIAAVVMNECGEGYKFTLDANEQFTETTQLLQFSTQVYQDPSLARFFSNLLLVEQPLSRKVALSPGQEDIRQCWECPVPIIIDESDGAWDDLSRALALGYSGVSHKNCKGVFKGLRNFCLIARARQEQSGERPWITSAEDLCNVGPVALLQDLAVQASFGNASIERNGHHYFPGLRMLEPAISSKLLQTHGDLFAEFPPDACRLKVTNGHMELGSVNRAPFGLRPLI